MKLSDIPRALNPAAWLAVAAVVALLFFGGWWVLTEPGRQRAKANEAGAETIQAQGQAAAGKDAVKVLSDGAKRDAQTDQQTQESRDAILSAPGASAPVDAAVDDAGRRAHCLRPSARRDPQCKSMQPARP